MLIFTAAYGRFRRRFFPDQGGYPLVGETGVPPQKPVFRTGEFWMAALALAGLIGLRIVYAFIYRVDSDEPQHLHIVWGWVHGLLPYRDLFDNHSPLFQMLCAPLMELLGEHAWIVVPMRLAMLPLYIADLWLIYLIGRALYVRRWAVWMALVAGSVPSFFLVTTEFRPDDLWCTLWLAAIWLVVSGRMAGRRAFFFGLTMGTCCAVSVKTVMLSASLGTALVGLLALNALSRRKMDVRSMLGAGGMMLAGMVIMPALMIGYFAMRGALRQMYYCVLEHNAAPGLGSWRKPGFHLWEFPLSIPVLFGLAWLCLRSAKGEERIGAGRALVLMTCGSYYFLLRYCPLVTAQDFLPFLPLAALTALPVLFQLLSLTRWPARIMIPAAAVLLLACDGAWICRLQSPRDNEMKLYEQSLAIALHLTNKDDLVMDGKGETIFRSRPIYWVLEGVTLRRIQLGLISDNVKARMIQTETCVAMNHRLRPRDQTWLAANFLEGDGKVWVAGERLGLAHPSMTFHTDIKGMYSIVSDEGKLVGSIDGTTLLASEEIAPGNHRLEIATGNGDVALIWTQALERGFNPFTGRIRGVPQ